MQSAGGLFICERFREKKGEKYTEGLITAVLSKCSSQVVRLVVTRLDSVGHGRSCD